MTTPARILAAATLCCWAVSWFLPVIDGYAGWEAFRAALAGPFKEGYPGRGEESIPQLLSALTNVVFVVLLHDWARDRWTRDGRVRGSGLRVSMFLRIALVCVLVNLYWPVQMWRAGVRDGLLAGYWLWLAAFVGLFALGAINAASARRTSRTPTADTPA